MKATPRLVTRDFNLEVALAEPAGLAAYSRPGTPAVAGFEVFRRGRFGLFGNSAGRRRRLTSRRDGSGRDRLFNPGAHKPAR